MPNYDSLGNCSHFNFNQRINFIDIISNETIKMVSTIYCKCFAVFVVILVLVCSCDSFKIKVKTKVKRKVESSNHVNKIVDYGISNHNSTDKAIGTGRGFFPPGSIFTLGKVLNFFPVGGERECQPTKGYTVARSGICLNPYDCRQRDGKAGGDCAHGLGVCCVFEVTCGGVVQNNLTYFMSPGFPELWSGKGDCNITIDKSYAGIMQLRVDFVHFSIGQPNRRTGECDDDVMTLGDDGNQFRICGQNHGQHIYYTLSTSTEAREADELAGHKRTRLSIRTKGSNMPRLWLMRLAQLPLAYSAPHDCLQYFTERTGTISTFNYAVNGRYLADQEYRACIRKNAGFCAVRYQPCDEASFRIGPGSGVQTYSAAAETSGPGASGGPGTGFYGPDGSLVLSDTTTVVPSTPVTISGPLAVPTVPTVTDQQTLDTQNDPVLEEGMMPADEVQEEDMEGSGNDPQIESVPVPTPAPVPSIASRIWSFIWPSWLWGQSSRGRSFGSRVLQDLRDSNDLQDLQDTRRPKLSSQNGPRSISRKVWGFWSPYAQHYVRDDADFLYQGYGNFGLDLNGFGRQRCQDRITIPCDNEYLISNTTHVSGVCDPHHCGPSFCPGSPYDRCHVQSTVSPFAVSVHFGPPTARSPEENIGACLMYTLLPCDS